MLNIQQPCAGAAPVMTAQPLPQVRHEAQALVVPLCKLHAPRLLNLLHQLVRQVTLTLRLELCPASQTGSQRESKVSSGPDACPVALSTPGCM